MNRFALIVLGAVLGAAAVLFAGDALRVPGSGVTPTPAARSGTAGRDAHEQDEDDAEDEERSPARLSSEAGEVFVVLSASERVLSGIESAPADRVSARPEIAVTGEVLDTAALGVDAARLAGAGRTVGARRATLAALEARLATLRALEGEGGIVGARELSALELSLGEARERLVAAEAALDDARAMLTARWGRTLAGAVLNEAPVAAALAAGELRLVRFALPADAPAPETLAVGRTDERAAGRLARLLGPAPVALGGARGPSFEATSEDVALRPGMRVTVWLGAREAVAGALLPHAAQVWHEGGRWFFVERAPGRFSLEPVPDGVAVADGTLIAPPDGPIVTRGAQVLLAERFRGQIPEEDED